MRRERAGIDDAAATKLVEEWAAGAATVAAVDQDSLNRIVVAMGNKAEG